jgi:hypothetical protein
MRAVAVALVCALTAVSAGCSDDVEAGQSPPADARLPCSSVITDEVLSTLGWKGHADSATESAGRCEWAGDAGTITTGDRIGSLDEECDRISSEDGYQASTTWLEDDAVSDGCLVAQQDGTGLFEVIAQQGDGVVQVRLALVEETPLDAVRRALVLLTTQASPGLL